MFSILKFTLSSKCAMLINVMYTIRPVAGSQPNLLEDTMNHRLRKPLSALTALALLWGLTLPAAASQALGDDLTTKETELHGGFGGYRGKRAAEGGGLYKRQRSGSG